MTWWRTLLGLGREPDPRPTVILPQPPEDPGEASIPRGLKIATAWAWRSLIVLAALFVLILAIGKLQHVVIPVAIAMLLTAVLQPVAGWLIERGLPRSLSAAAVLIGGIACVAGVVTVVVQQFVHGMPDLIDQVSAGIDDAKDWAVTGPLDLSREQVDNTFNGVDDWLSDHRDTLTSGAVSTAMTLGQVLTGTLLALFTFFFMLRDGRRIWLWLLGLLPKPAQEPLDNAGTRSYVTLVSYVRATMLVAFVDGVGIGVWLAVLGVPLAIPLGVLVFLGGFVPLVGAVTTGVLAILVALVAEGWVTALLVLIGVLVVQQLEGHVLQPVLLGRAVQLHPLAVVLSIAVGIVLAGIIGALVAVPIAACLNTGIRALRPAPAGAAESAPRPAGSPPG